MKGSGGKQHKGSFRQQLEWDSPSRGETDYKLQTEYSIKPDNMLYDNSPRLVSDNML
jgi:hypothetical protein